MPRKRKNIKGQRVKTFVPDPRKAEAVEFASRPYYVYRYRDADGYVIYVGKGRGGRAWEHLDMATNKRLAKALVEMRTHGMDPIPEVVARFEVEQHALDAELGFIRAYTNSVNPEQRRRLTNWLNVVSDHPVEHVGWFVLFGVGSKPLTLKIMDTVENIQKDIIKTNERWEKIDGLRAELQKYILDNTHGGRLTLEAFQKVSQHYAIQLRENMGGYYTAGFCVETGSYYPQINYLDHFETEVATKYGTPVQVHVASYIFDDVISETVWRAYYDIVRFTEKKEPDAAAVWDMTNQFMIREATPEIRARGSLVFDALERLLDLCAVSRSSPSLP